MAHVVHFVSCMFYQNETYVYTSPPEGSLGGLNKGVSAKVRQGNRCSQDGEDCGLESAGSCSLLTLKPGEQ